MDPSMQEGLSQLFEELREVRENAASAIEDINAVEEKSTVKNKMITATVDGRGRLTELDLRGDRWRDMPPKELSAAVVDAVNRAQEKAQKTVAELASTFSPGGLDVSELMSKAPDMDALFPDFEKMFRSFNE